MKYNLKNAFDLGKFKAYCEKLIEQQAKVEVIEFSPEITFKQLKYYNVIVALFAAETGYTVSKMKTICKIELNLYYEKDGEFILRSISQLSKREASEYITKLKHLAGMAGVYLPNPGEFMKSQFEIEKQIERLNRIQE